MYNIIIIKIDNDEFMYSVVNNLMASGLLFFLKNEENWKMGNIGKMNMWGEET